MLYEFFALCLNIDVSFQKMMYIVGGGNAGKSLTLEYINHIVGRENVSHISPQSLSHRFQSAFLMQKLLNSVTDISSKPIRETNVIKQLSGEDAISAECVLSGTVVIRVWVELSNQTNRLSLT